MRAGPALSELSTASVATTHCTLREETPFAVEKSVVSEDKLMEVALEAGADDLQSDDPEIFEIYTAPDTFEAVRQALESAKIATVEAKLDMVPSNYVSLDEGKSRQAMKLLEALDDHDDVQNVYSNFDVPAEMMETA